MNTLDTPSGAVTVADRIRYIIKQSRMSQAQFSRRLGIDPANLSKHLNGHLPITAGLINRIAVDMGISKRWLLDGSDVPFSKHPEPAANKNLTPIYDVDVTAGSTELSMLLTEDRIIGAMAFPDLPQDCVIVHVSGDSMTPEIVDGSYIAIRPVSDRSYIFWGQIYVIVLDDYRLVKYVRRHPSDPSKVVLRSANPDYDDMEVAIADIRRLFIVESIMNIRHRC
ncbi:MAG: XRE family transcriptional regulator [Muribaculaceae bacterium]|nr:XRE family transcriptional regulator [Muribaculaceae bacterium]